MNLNRIMKKLQLAILQTGLVIKINTRQFFSQDQNRMITIFVLSTPVTYINTYGKCKLKDFEILSSASGIEIVKCLNDIYRAVKIWN